MTIQHTTNFHIAYADTATQLKEFAAVTQEVAQSLDGAMGRAGYTPPDSSTFAALAARVTAVEGKATDLRTDLTALQAATAALLQETPWFYQLDAAYPTGTSTDYVMTTAWATVPGCTRTRSVPAGRALEVEWATPLIDVPNGAGAQVRIAANVGAAGAMVAGDGVYVSNTGATGLGIPGRLRALFRNTGTNALSINYAVQAQRVGAAATVALRTLGVANMTCRDRIVL